MQIPWIMSGSVRDNILFGKELNVTRYRCMLKVIHFDLFLSLYFSFISWDHCEVSFFELGIMKL